MANRQKRGDISLGNGVKTVGLRIFSWLRYYSLQLSTSMQAGEAEEDGIKQQQRMNIMTDTVRKIKAKGRMDANNSWCTSDLLCVDCKKTLKTVQQWHNWLHEMKKKDGRRGTPKAW